MKKVVLMLLLLICSLAVFSQTSQEDESIILEKLGITLPDTEESRHSEELRKNLWNFTNENFKAIIKKDRGKNCIKITIKNISKKDILVPKFKIPDELRPINDLFSLKRIDGTEIEYIGAIGSFALFTDESFILLKPNHSIKRQFDLSKFYEINGDEPYTVQYRSWNVQSNQLRMN